MLFVAICVAILEITGYTEANLGDRRSVNVALETVLAFNNRDNEKNIKFIDDFQSFLSKVKETVANKGRRKIETKHPKRRSSGRINDLKFTDFIKELIVILKDYQNEDLEDVFAVIDDEIRKYHYKGCKFYELVSNRNVRKYVAETLDSVKEQSGTLLKKKLDQTLQIIENAKYNARQTEILDYIDSLYTKRDDEKFQSVLDNFDMYKAKSKRANVDIIKLVRDSIRSVVFDHYSNLNKVIRQDLKGNIEDFFANTIYYDPDEPKTIEITTENFQIANEIVQMLRDPTTTLKPSALLKKPDKDKFKNNVINFDFNFDDRFIIKDDLNVPNKIPVIIDVVRKDSKSTEGDIEVTKNKKNQADIHDNIEDSDSTTSKETFTLESYNNDGPDHTMKKKETINNVETLATISKHDKKPTSSAHSKKKKQKLRNKTKYTETTIPNTTKKTKQRKHKKKHAKKQVEKEIQSFFKFDQPTRGVFVTEMAEDLNLLLTGKGKEENIHYVPQSKKNKAKRNKIHKTTLQSKEIEIAEKVSKDINYVKNVETSTKKTVNIFESLQHVIEKISNKIDENSIIGSGSKISEEKSKINSQYEDNKNKDIKDEDTFVTYAPKKSGQKSKNKRNDRDKPEKKHKKAKKNKYKDQPISFINDKSSLSYSLGNKLKKTYNKTKKIKQSKPIQRKRIKEKETVTSVQETSANTFEETDKANVANKILANNYLNKLTTTNKNIITKEFIPTTLKSNEVKGPEPINHRLPLYLSRSDQSSDDSLENQEPLQVKSPNIHAPRKYNLMEIPIKRYLADNLRRQESKRLSQKITTRERNPIIKRSRRLNGQDDFRMSTNAITFIPLEDFQRENGYFKRNNSRKNSDFAQPKDLLELKYNIKPKSQEYYWTDPTIEDNLNTIPPKYIQNNENWDKFTSLGLDGYIPIGYKTTDIQNISSKQITTKNLYITEETKTKDAITTEISTKKLITTPKVNTTNTQNTTTNEKHIDLDTFIKNINTSVTIIVPTEVPKIFDTTLSNLNKTVPTTEVHENLGTVKANITDDNDLPKVNITIDENNFDKFIDYEGEFSTNKHNEITTTLSNVLKDLVPMYKSPEEIHDIYDRNIIAAYKEDKAFNDPLLQPLNIIGDKQESEKKVITVQDMTFINMENTTAKQLQVFEIRR